MKQLTLPGGDILTCDDRSAIIKLSGLRRVLSTSFLNGGMRDDLHTLFNYSEVYGREDECCEMRAPTCEGHIRSIVEELGLNPNYSTGLSTAAKMKYVQVEQAGYDDFKLTAVVTAGLDVSGNRIGDPTEWHEKKGMPVRAHAGTINIILHTDACLTRGAMTRTLTLCSEAKTAALQEVLAPSCFSDGLATGSGTDGIIVVSNLDSPVELTNAGSHFKLGQITGDLVKNTVIAALVAENGFEAYARGSMLKRVSRFGLNEETLWAEYCILTETGETDRDLFNSRLRRVSRDESIILKVTLYGHLVDLLRWRLADTHDTLEAASEIISFIPGVDKDILLLSNSFPLERDELAVAMQLLLKRALSRLLSAM
jgi:adenosylcobinamide amidohydrolase